MSIVEESHYLLQVLNVFASSINNTDLIKIENPARTNRDKFFSLIGHCHWTLEELKDGSYWNRVKSFIA